MFGFTLWWEETRVRTTKVMDVSTRGLGNGMLKNPAAMRIASLFIADLDVVAPEDVSRSVLFPERDGTAQGGRNGPHDQSAEPKRCRAGLLRGRTPRPQA